jgi:hypothetical protein
MSKKCQKFPKFPDCVDSTEEEEAKICPPFG